jgi:hypothetical protein
MLNANDTSWAKGMPGWMIERTAILRLEGEAARHPEVILIERQHSSSLLELKLLRCARRHEWRSLSRFHLTPVIRFMDELLPAPLGASDNLICG